MGPSRVPSSIAPATSDNECSAGRSLKGDRLCLAMISRTRRAMTNA